MSTTTIKKPKRGSRYAYLKDLAYRLLGGKCSSCGATERLEVHHKDGDPSNNSRKNLVLLCRHHHREQHHRAVGSVVTLNIAFDYEEYKKLEKARGTLTWREFLLTKC